MNSQTAIIATPNFYNQEHLEFYTATRPSYTLAMAAAKEMLRDFRRSNQPVIGTRIIATSRYHKLSREDRLQTLFRSALYA